MNPAECNSRDWYLYYNGTWMHHEEFGVVYVHAQDRTLQVNVGDGNAHACEPELLSCLWPEPGAINFRTHAAYVGRRGRREARRSATSHHYWFVYASRPGMLLNTAAIRRLVNIVDYPDLDQAMESDRISTAITRDVIVTNTRDVIYKGLPAGSLVMENHGWIYKPLIEASIMDRRIAFKLGKLGIACH